MCESKNVCVVVLGDIGRSPRMQYHSLSLAEMGHKVDILGYGETQPLADVKSASSIYYHYMMPCPQIPIRLLNYAFKTIWQTINLMFLMFFIRRPDIILVQNPPAVPTLIVCWIAAKILRAQLFVDWHNYAHSIMALNLSKDHVLVKITKLIEKFVGQRADCNFCVTNSMKEHLMKNWNIQATTLYDRPQEIFQSISLEEKHKFLMKFGQKYEVFLKDCQANETIFTNFVNNRVELKNPRPSLLISSTSWTEDEDFSTLLTALQTFENHHNEGNEKKLPNLVCVITGKGHLKEYYCNEIAARNWQHVIVITPWLEFEDYPKILASADLGVCLHTSSSGLDLPMKVVDMYGCGLPVCAYNFESLHELVEHGKNGYVFANASQLANQLLNWFEDFPNNKLLEQTVTDFKKELQKFQSLRWQENWTNIASKHFK